MDREARSERAPLIEIFHSIQGEGRHVGRPMAFVRVATCPIRCTYCDTPDSYEAEPEFTARVGDESRVVRNPVEAVAAATIAAEVAGGNTYGPTRFVSLTGGEPLVFPGFVNEFGAALHDLGLALFLESAAVDPPAFAQCLEVVDHASLDYKLPGTLAEGDPGTLADACVECVRLAVEAGVPVDVKFVLTPSVEEADLERALAQLRPFRDGIEVILQPVTPFGVEGYPCPADRVAACNRLAVAAGFAARVLPQTHKMLGVP